MEQFVLVEVGESRGPVFRCISLKSDIVINNRIISIVEYNENRTQHVFNRYFVSSMHFTPYTDFNSVYAALLASDPRNRK